MDKIGKRLRELICSTLLFNDIASLATHKLGIHPLTVLCLYDL